jgi:hypothetical protein
MRIHPLLTPEEGKRCPDCGYVVVTGLCCQKGRERREKLAAVSFAPDEEKP